MDEVRWLTFEDLKNWFEMDPQQFTPWFAEAFRRMMRPQES
jgi:isopentenyldiphosphate isomerase